jgi:hypothetical protein
MKKILKMCLYGGLVSLCVMAFSPRVYSQEQETSAESDISPKFGIKGGINLANLYVDDVKDHNLKVGLNAGIFAKVPLVRGLSIQPELLYSSKGSKVTYDNFVLGSGEYRFNLNYLEAPVSLVVNLARNFNIHGGAYAAYLLNANITDMNDDGTIQDVDNLNADKFNRFDYGLLAGLGVDVQNFTIGARYNYGLRQIGKSGSFSGQLLNNSKNSAVTLYIGFGF